MTKFGALLTLWVLLTGFPVTQPLAQTIAPSAPQFADLERSWAALWDALGRGDVPGARQHVHSSRQHLFPGERRARELQDLARQMQFCRLVFNPLPVDVNEVVYSVQCRHGSETAETLASFRKDLDGVWRLVAF